MEGESFKYPSTPHLPWSPGVSRDDKTLKSVAHFEGAEIVATQKMDGENTTLLRTHFHARSLDSRHHVSRDWIARFHGEISYRIPEGWRICGENLFARHSIAYDDLPSYFMGFSVWDERNVSLSWDDTLMVFDDLGIVPVPEIYRGVWSESVVRKLWSQDMYDTVEGIVVRRSGEIAYDDFDQCMAKFVRKGHVQTDSHWMHREVIPNGLAQSARKDFLFR